MKTILLTIWVMLTGSLFAFHKSTVCVNKLYCENRTNPLGIETKQPRLSWILDSEFRNQIQTGYQILVSENIQSLDKNIGEFWDSRKVLSDQSLFIPYNGQKLTPSTKYYWKVRAWDKNGIPSDWSEPGSWVMGLMNEDNWHGAKWIGYRQLPDSMRLVPGYKNAEDARVGNRCKDRAVIPCFRKEFKIVGNISEATLYISGLGHYECFLNGQQVGNDLLIPGWTDYDKTVLYNTYDVTGLVKDGKNVVGVLVGNGFYYINKERYAKFVISYGEPALIGLIKIRYTNGLEEYIVTDQNWKSTPSPIIYSSIYGGEDYDATREQKGWNNSDSDFDDSAWQSSLCVKKPSGNLIAESDYPVTVKEIIPAKSIITLSDGSLLYDFGQNASGIVELKVQGKKGANVVLIPSELITEDNLPDQKASGAPYYFTYTLKGEGVETWRPRFSYYGLRYVQVKGAISENHKKKTELPHIVDLQMLHLRNSSPEAGSFVCSNNLFNKTNDLIKWAINSNMQSVFTDCPHREKHGWLEETYLMGNSLAFNYDIYHLFKNTVSNMRDAQTGEGLVPSFVPEYRQSTGGFRDSPEWGSASILLPWLICKIYGDTAIIHEAWNTMTHYAAYLASKSVNHILSYGLGDWFDLGLAEPGVSQLTPVSLTATAIYYYDLALLSQMAFLIDRKDEGNHYASLAEEIKLSFNNVFFDCKRGVYSTGSQTAMAMPYVVGLVDDEYKNKVLNNLEDSIKQSGNRLTAGDIGFHFLVKALTDGGKSQLLFDMNARDDVPGYGYQIRKGATTLTESWQALSSVSNNHLMLGHIMEWFYAGIAGIRQQEGSSGYKKIEIKPEMVGDIDSASANHFSPYGNIVSEWHRNKDKLTLKIDIPVNTTAKVFIPVLPEQTVVESGKNVEEMKDVYFIEINENKMIFYLGSGKYLFETVGD